MNDDDLIKPLDLDSDEDAEELDDLDDPLLPGVGKKGPKKDLEGEDSLDALAEEEDGILPEDSFDDVEPEDLW